jgi:hypothetical protein
VLARLRGLGVRLALASAIKSSWVDATLRALGLTAVMGLAFALRNPATTQLLLDAADCVIDALAEWEPEQLLRQVALAAPVGHHWATDVG